jgi:hypothetical protein
VIVVACIVIVVGVVGHVVLVVIIVVIGVGNNDTVSVGENECDVGSCAAR